MPTLRASQKGQLVIPAYLRRKYGIQAPGRAVITEKDGKIIVVPAVALDHTGRPAWEGAREAGEGLRVWSTYRRIGRDLTQGTNCNENCEP